jgi:CheY-like chemotaxis protein
MKIIVVDDDATNRLVVRFLMEMKGFVVIEADSGPTAKAVLSEEGVDAVLMDLQMPEVDGYQATRMLRDDGLDPAVPVIALTSNTSDEARNLCLSSGMNGFILKPFEASTAEVIRSILEQQAATSPGQAVGWLVG